MSEKKANLAAVSTFADHEVILALRDAARQAMVVWLEGGPREAGP